MPGETKGSGEPAFNHCKRVAPGRLVRVNLRPDTPIGDLIYFVSAITCTPFLIPSTVALTGKTVTIISPQPMTVGEVRRLFYLALDSVGLTVVPDGRFLRVVDAARARMGSIPFYGADDAIPDGPL